MGEAGKPIPKAIAVCGECGSHEFAIGIYDCGHYHPFCAKCSASWEAPWIEELNEFRAAKAVASDGHESTDLVSEEEIGGR